MFPATRRSSKRSVVYKPFGFLIRNGPVDVLSMFTTEKRAYDNTPRRRQSRHVAEWNACVWTTSGSRYVMFMSTFRRIVVCTLYGSLYATLRKPDNVHTTLRLHAIWTLLSTLKRQRQSVVPYGRNLVCATRRFCRHWGVVTYAGYPASATSRSCNQIVCPTPRGRTGAQILESRWRVCPRRDVVSYGRHPFFQTQHCGNQMACIQYYVCRPFKSSYVTFLSTSKRSVVCTPYSSVYATSREPDSLHPAQRLDVDRTVAYGKNKWLDTTLWRPSRIGKRMACIRHIHIHIHIYTYACTTSGLRYATVLLTSRRSDECTPLGSRNFAKL